MGDYHSDSGMDTTCSSDMESITSSNYEFRHDGKRRYHGIDSNRYPLPNDSEEVVRLDKLHYMFRCINRRNVLAPISPNATGILDVGTGSGRWVVEVAQEYEKANVFGMDLSPANPLYEITENVEFIVGDLTEGLKFDDSSLDLVHSRIINAGVPQPEWPIYISEVFRVLKPGNGWIQCTEMRGHCLFAKGNVPEDSALREFDRNFHHYCQSVINTYTTGEHLEGLVRAAGFTDVKVRMREMHIGNWDRTTNARLADARRIAVDVWSGAYGALVENLKDFYPDEVERAKFVERLKADLVNPDYHLYSIAHVVVGRKPDVDV